MLLHLSDLHFGTEQHTVCEALKRWVSEHQPEAIVVSGDLTQRARSQQFDTARRFLDSLQKPFLVVPGNHDIPMFDLGKRWLSPFESFVRYFGPVETTLETPHFYLIGVNSITRLNHTQGSISPLQIWQTGERLKHVPAGKIPLIAVHQPFAVIDPEDADDIASLMPQAVKHWASHGCRGFLHGHFHSPVVFDLSKKSHLSTSVLDIQAGTGVSRRLRRGYPNSFNAITPDLSVIRWDFSVEKLAFERVMQLWPLEGRFHEQPMGSPSAA